QCQDQKCEMYPKDAPRERGDGHQVLLPVEVARQQHVRSPEQHQEYSHDLQMRVYRHIDFSIRKTRTNGVIENSSRMRRPAAAAVSRHVRSGRKCQKPGPKARKFSQSRTCSTTAISPPADSTAAARRKRRTRESCHRISCAVKIRNTASWGRSFAQLIG